MKSPLTTTSALAPSTSTSDALSARSALLADEAGNENLRVEVVVLRRDNGGLGGGKGDLRVGALKFAGLADVVLLRDDAVVLFSHLLRLGCDLKLLRGAYGVEDGRRDLVAERELFGGDGGNLVTEMDDDELLELVKLGDYLKEET